ncbi:MAG: tripartite tricarboxylate transporter substrate binding protein, partial [Gammaproteobacteria bacterium]|nr:tripartite tricarboxylate transporter substrate binding protein [Gammaproteobacteria bacterium]
MIRKTLLLGIVFLAGATMTGPVLADYPEKPVTLICWSSAGSGHDLMARMIAKVGEKYLGEPIVVVNKQGGSGRVAMSYVLNQKPDGHVLMTNTRSMTLRFREANARLSIDDFRYIGRVVRDPFVIVVNEDSPFQTIDELFDHARANPNEITIGGYSTRSVDESLVEEVEAAAKIELNYIPYRGGKEPVVAVLGGHIDVALANPSEMITNYQAGNLRVLALVTEERFQPFEDVPTLTERGYPVAPDYWRGVMAAKDVPDAVVDKWDEVLEQVVADPEFREFL